MSVLNNVLSAVQSLPRGYPADGRRLGLGLAAALDAQRDYWDKARAERDERQPVMAN